MGEEEPGIGLRGLIVWLVLFGVALEVLVGWPPRFPPLPSAWPSWPTIEVWLDSAILPTNWLIPAVGLVAWAIWGWSTGFVLLRVTLNALDAITRGAAWVRSLRGASDWLMIPAVRRAVDASLAGMVMVRVATVPVTAAAQPLEPIAVVAHAPVEGFGTATPVGSGLLFDTSAIAAPAAEVGPDEIIHAVRRHDTWSSISCEYFGDGSHAEQLLNANVGRLQPDGRRISRQGLIYQGDAIGVPASSRPAKLAEGVQQVVVNTGDTLWGLAERDLGDGRRWPEIFSLSKGAVSPDGHVLTDPNVIWPRLVVNEPAQQTPMDQESEPEPEVDSVPQDERAVGLPATDPTPTPVVASSSPAATATDVTPTPEDTPETVTMERPSPTPLALVSMQPDPTTERVSLPATNPEPPSRRVSPLAGGAAGAGLAIAGLAGTGLLLRRRHRAPDRTQPESDAAMMGGFAEAQPLDELSSQGTGDDLSTASRIVSRLSRALAAQMIDQGWATSDDLPTAGTVLAAVRHGRSSTTLMLQGVPMAVRTHLIACLPGAATRAFGEKSDVEGMVSRDGDVLVRLTGVAHQVQVGADDGRTDDLEFWPEPTMFLRLGLLADRQVFAANWDALGHVLVAAPLGQGAEAVLSALLTPLIARRSPADLRLLIVGTSRSLPEELLDLPHCVAPRVDPYEEQAAVAAFTSLREELEHRIAAGQTDGPDFVVVLPELGQLSAEHMAALGPVMLHGPRHRMRVIAASARRAVELAQHCTLLPEFGTRLVLRTANEEDSIALLGSDDATELGAGGHMLIRVEGRVPLQAHGYRVAPDRLARLAEVIRSNAENLDLSIPLISSDGAPDDPITTRSAALEAPTEVTTAPEPLVTPISRPGEGVAGPGSDPGAESELDAESRDAADDKVAVEVVTPPLPALSAGPYPGQSPSPAETSGTPDDVANTQPTPHDTPLVSTPHLEPQSNGPSAAVLSAPRPRLRGRFLGARELVYDGQVVWPVPGVRDEAQLELVVFLGVQDPTGVRAELLSDAFWEEDDDAARVDRLKKRRYRLRRALSKLVPGFEGDVLARMDRQHPIYRLNPTVIESDVHRFLKLLEEAKSLPRDAAAAAYEEALQLHRGELLDRPDVPPYRWLDEGARLTDLRVKYAAMAHKARRQLADLMADGTDAQLARAEELYIGLAGEDPLDHRLWEGLARVHARRNDLLGLEATIRRLRSALVELGEADDPDRVTVPPTLQRVFAEVRACLLKEQAA